MKAKFYTVKFQFPLLWKIFLASGISLTYCILTMSNLRKSIYQAVPFKLAAVHLNSFKEKDVSRSAVDLLQSQDGTIYSVDKYKITKYSGIRSEEELSKERYLRICNGKYQALNICEEYNGALYAGDWYGGFHTNQSGQWKKVFQADEKKARILGIHKKNDHFYLTSSKGLLVLNSQFKLISHELKEEYIYDSKVVNHKLYILTAKQVLLLENEKMTPVHSRTKNVRASKLSQSYGDLVLLTDKGVMFLEKDGSLSPGFLPEYSITDYTTDGNFEAATVYKQGIFIRKSGGEWIQFPSPAKTKARSSDLLIKDGVLWAAFYSSGLYRIDIKRLLELEDRL